MYVSVCVNCPYMYVRSVGYLLLEAHILQHGAFPCVDLLLALVTRKQTLRSLLLSYPEKGAHPSLGMTPTLREYDLWSQKTQILKSRCHTKKSMDTVFGMTTTKTLRSVFSRRASLNSPLRFSYVSFYGVAAP